MNMSGDNDSPRTMNKTKSKGNSNRKKNICKQIMANIPIFGFFPPDQD